MERRLIVRAPCIIIVIKMYCKIQAMRLQIKIYRQSLRMEKEGKTFFLPSPQGNAAL